MTKPPQPELHGEPNGATHAFRRELEKLLNDYGLFDAAWYKKSNPDVAKAGVSPLSHYLSSGFIENRSPHPFFDPKFYLNSDQALVDSGLPAIEHYLRSGGAERRKFHPFIDTEVFHKLRGGGAHTRGAFVDLCTNDDAASCVGAFAPQYYQGLSGVNGSPRELLHHFLSNGAENAINPHPLIQFEELAKLTPGKTPIECFDSLLSAKGGAYAHENLHPSFDAKFFSTSYGANPQHPLLAYITQGRIRALNPNPIFDSEFYIEQLGGRELSLDPLSHYILNWAKGEAEPNRYFDSPWYARQYAKSLGENETPLDHYLKWGHTPWFSPGPRFAQRFYITRAGLDESAGENALSHYLQTGRDEGLTPSTHEFFDRNDLRNEDELFAIVRELAAARSCENPLVTVIVPTYGNLGFTLRCAASVLRSKDKTPFHLLIVDDNSPDGAGERMARELATLSCLTVQRNPENRGFLRACNDAAAAVETEFFLLLNNDTTVLDGWLDELAQTFSSCPEAGLVGSKLIYPNGLLQEAGGIIWMDGDAANFGRMDDPQAPQYNYRRDVDYISGAAIMVRTKAWRDVGGFSDELAPAYYEDTDFAMKLRAADWRVVYQPLSEIIHHEGITSGTDIADGAKKYQAINKGKFAEKWRDATDLNGAHGNFSRHIVDRRPKGRILIFDAETPTPDKDSGSVTAWNNCRILTDLGYRVTFMPASGSLGGAYGRALQRIGVEVLTEPYVNSCQEYLLEQADRYDALILSRASTGGVVLPAIKARHPGVPIIFDTVDIHYIRLLRQYGIDREHSTLEEAHRMKHVELSAIRGADLTLLVSTYEETQLRAEIGAFPHAILPLIYEPATTSVPFAERADIAFVGGYRHPPNVDAVNYLMEKVWPAFRQTGVKARLHIIGSHMPPEFHQYASDDVVIAGFIPDLDEYLSNIRLTIAPLRYGAGVKGKVGNSLRLGTPVVATPIAAEGMGIENGKHALIAETPGAFSAAMAQLYSHNELWAEISSAGVDYVSRHYGLNVATSLWRDILAKLIK